MAVKEFPNVFKGLSTNPAFNTDYFETAQNVTYGRDKRLRTRNGYAAYGQPVPAAAVTVDLLDATTGWTAAEDANTVAVGTAIRGAQALSFNVTTTGALAANVVKTTLAANITTAKGYVGFFVKVPAGFNTNLTDVRLRLGSDASNYYEWTLPALTEGTAQYVVLSFASAVTTGTPADASIAYARLRLTYVAGYANQTGVIVDDIRCYSALSTSPVASLFSFMRDDTQKNYTLAACGTSMWSLEDNGYWSEAFSGITEFETAAGWTDCRTRWSFCVYLNVVYMCNGVDSYRAWNGTAVTLYAGQPKYRFLRYMADRVFGAGDDANPTKIYYTASLPADASTVNTNSGIVGGDEQGRIRALKDIGSSVLAGKDRKIYSVGITGSFSATGIDPRNGIMSHRSVENVGNALLYFNDSGIDQLANRQGVTGAAALADVPLGEEIASMLSLVPGRFPDQQAVKGVYMPDVRNYYLFYPTSGNVPDSCLVYSGGVGAWTKYQLPGIYDAAVVYRGDGSRKLVAAPTSGGQLISLEEGFNDAGIAFTASILSKARDFGTPGIFKYFEFVDVIGWKSQGDPLEVTAYLDGQAVSSGTVTDDLLNLSLPSYALAGFPLAGAALAGSDTSESLELYPFVIRLPVYSYGYAFQYGLESASSSSAWALQKARVSVESEQIDLIESASVA